MIIPLDRLAALCPLEIRPDLALLSPRQLANLRRKIRWAVQSAKMRNPYGDGIQSYEPNRNRRKRYLRSRATKEIQA